MDGRISQIPVGGFSVAFPQGWDVRDLANGQHLSATQVAGGTPSSLVESMVSSEKKPGAVGISAVSLNQLGQVDIITLMKIDNAKQQTCREIADEEALSANREASGHVDVENIDTTVGSANSISFSIPDPTGSAKAFTQRIYLVDGKDYYKLSYRALVSPDAKPDFATQVLATFRVAESKK